MLSLKWKTHAPFHILEVKPFVQGNCPVDYEKMLRECAYIEADEEFHMDEMKGSIKRWNSLIYHIKWLGFPKETDCTLEPYKNFSEGARMKLLQFHINNPNTPHDYRVTSE